MRRLSLFTILLILAALFAPACRPPELDQADELKKDPGKFRPKIIVVGGWARASKPGIKVTAAYLNLHNNTAEAEFLIGVESSVAGRIEMHKTIQENGMGRMVKQTELEIPAKGSLQLKPGGTHLMLMDLKEKLKAGQRINLTLLLKKSGRARASVLVKEDEYQ